MADLRSDTLTRPSAAMLAAMSAAEVGDDVYGEDPAVNALQEEVADLFGHEAGLFTPTGSMGNQLAMRVLTPPHTEVLCDDGAHVVTFELAAAAEFGRLSTRTWASDRGVLDPERVAAMVREPAPYWVPTGTVAVEQTHNLAGGTVQPLSVLEELRELTPGVGLHCDGARIWNAHVATGVPLRTYGQLFDTVSVCFSKGLGAPVGSMLLSSRDRVAEARVLRKRLGGGMRQLGYLAAAAAYAVRNNVERLAEDHARAKRLAELAGADPGTVETNIVLLPVPAAAAVVEKCRAEGVQVGSMGPRLVRAVVHLDVDDAGIERAGRALRNALA